MNTNKNSEIYLEGSHPILNGMGFEKNHTFLILPSNQMNGNHDCFINTDIKRFRQNSRPFSSIAMHPIFVFYLTGKKTLK